MNSDLLEFRSPQLAPAGRAVANFDQSKPIGDAVRVGGALKDASDIVWYNDPDDEHPISGASISDNATTQSVELSDEDEDEYEPVIP